MDAFGGREDAEAISSGESLVDSAIIGDNDGEAVNTSDKTGDSSSPDELWGIWCEWVAGNAGIKRREWNGEWVHGCM